jgi:hypothetical protein
MKKRNVGSPDRADAVFGAMTPVRRMQSYNLIDRRLGRWTMGRVP